MKVPVNALPDNDWIRFEFAPIASSEGKKFVLVVQSEDAIPGQAVTIYYDSHCSLDESELWISGRKQPGALTFRTYCLHRTDLMPVPAPVPVLLPEGPHLRLPESTSPIVPVAGDACVAEIVGAISRIDRERNTQIRQLQHIIHEKQTYIHHLQDSLTAATNSRAWRLLNRMRSIIRKSRSLPPRLAARRSRT